MTRYHWHGLRRCEETHPGDCTGEWGCMCPDCRDRKHPLDIMARMTRAELDKLYAAYPGRRGPGDRQADRPR